MSPTPFLDRLHKLSELQISSSDVLREFAIMAEPSRPYSPHSQSILEQVRSIGDDWEQLPHELQAAVIDIHNRYTRPAASAPSVISDLSHLSELPLTPSGLDRAALDRKWRETQHLVPRHHDVSGRDYAHQMPHQHLHQHQQHQQQPQSEGQAILNRLQQSAPVSPRTPPSHPLQRTPLRVPGAWSPAQQRTASATSSPLVQRWAQEQPHLSPAAHTMPSRLPNFVNRDYLPSRPIPIDLTSNDNTDARHRTLFNSQIPTIPTTTDAQQRSLFNNPVPSIPATINNPIVTIPGLINNRRQRLVEKEREFEKANNEWKTMMHALVDQEARMWDLLAERQKILVDLREEEGSPAGVNLGAAVDLLDGAKKNKKRHSKAEKRAAKAATAAPAPAPAAASVVPDASSHRPAME
ncbi:hypothetical protein CkaCkLH20_12257 [Colletotrichum karsti]|uniref:Uncharacterized protein n=1 Tax=Colletotrichum karsti TaxID=1095194 RepID=A0A9P6HSW1_9PEZI|nr:uncharacterized protein CkaCkLH20_12257 [Colletotrichum karsti]KAF9870293.1 hypothetical protein CkaCkLH20_12257 [Colletotrichum karsti]